MECISGEAVLSGTYQCIGEGSQYSARLLVALPWVFYATWGILGLSLTLWVAFRHFREMKRWAIEDRLTALIKMHVIYFTMWACPLNFNHHHPEVLHVLDFALLLAWTSARFLHEYLYVEPTISILITHYIYFTELRFWWNWCLLWRHWNCPVRTDVCSGTMSHSSRSRIQRSPYDHFWRRNWHTIAFQERTHDTSTDSDGWHKRRTTAGYSAGGMKGSSLYWRIGIPRWAWKRDRCGQVGVIISMTWLTRFLLTELFPVI